MAYRYRRIDVRKGWLFWKARPVNIDLADGYGQACGMNLVPTRDLMAEIWWNGFTRQHAIARAYRWAKRQNRRRDRREAIQSFEFDSLEMKGEECSG